MTQEEKIENLVLDFYDIMEAVANTKEDYKKKNMIHDLVAMIYHDGHADGYNEAKSIYSEWVEEEENTNFNIETLKF